MVSVKALHNKPWFEIRYIFQPVLHPVTKHALLKSEILFTGRGLCVAGWLIKEAPSI